MGQQYAELFPDRIRALVLDSNTIRPRRTRGGSTSPPRIPSSTLLTYDGWGHGAYLRSPCVVDATDQYLISLTMPARGTHCPTNSLTQQ